MTLDACARLLERGDPDRLLAVRAAPAWTRARLLPLYAFNLEVARAPWVTQEPMIAEMRLQWWRDVVAEDVPPAHDVAGPLQVLIREAGLPQAVLDRLIAARHHDVWRAPFADHRALAAYVEDTAAGLMWLAARALGAPDGAEVAVRAYGWAAGMASFLRAVPELTARGRQPLPAGTGVADLALQGLARLAEARAGRALVPKAVAPALLAGWQAEGLLTLAARDPAAVREGRLQLSEFTRRRRLLWQAATGRW
ncbi:squalene/phytoene synthase family protein [Rhodobacter sp. Har01]|uniref:squalene/phytoene synthase family protein n=1 Tax=Rhodobacter sp. Har01 TaxID=2883999 RepID=UPI001D0869E2|nr:squalene/phytoene synthase family protein [Rhodobacter sp. Har01]MCB6177019.1 squalene/phytoene synthase family protein [Rhodobacter sp. Har01]